MPVSRIRLAASSAVPAVSRPASPTAAPSSRVSATSNRASPADASASTVQYSRATKASIPASRSQTSPERHRLHPARRAAARQLAPQHRGEPVAHQVVERPARLPRPHQVHVDPARPRQCRAYRRRRHLAERHPAHRPAADGVPFLQPAQHLPRRSPRPRGRGRSPAPGPRPSPAPAPRRRASGRRACRSRRPWRSRRRDRPEPFFGRQVADMAPGRDHPVVPAQPGPDGPRLGRRLDDDDIHDAPSAARAAPGAPGDRGAGIGQFFGRRETARPAPAGRRTRDGRVAARPAPVRDGHDRPAPRLPARAPRGSRAPRASPNPLRGREPD